MKQAVLEIPSPGHSGVQKEMEIRWPKKREWEEIRGGLKCGGGAKSWVKTFESEKSEPRVLPGIPKWGKRSQLLSYGNWPGSRLCLWVELKPRPSSVNLTHRSINHWNPGEEKAGKGGQRVKKTRLSFRLGYGGGSKEELNTGKNWKGKSHLFGECDQPGLKWKKKREETREASMAREGRKEGKGKKIMIIAQSKFWN